MACNLEVMPPHHRKGMVGGARSRWLLGICSEEAERPVLVPCQLLPAQEMLLSTFRVVLMPVWKCPQR